jgi:hypothetical protein
MTDTPPLTEVEITPAMIDAGEDVLLGTIGGPLEIVWYPRDLAVKVFLAMARLATSPP